MARGLRAAAVCCAAAIALSWAPRSAAQGNAQGNTLGAVSDALGAADARGVTGVSVMALGSAPGRGTAPSIALPQDQGGAPAPRPGQAPSQVPGQAPGLGLQALDAPDWPPFSGMIRPPLPRSPDRYGLRPVYFDSLAFESAADCLTAASLRRLPLEVCE